MGNGKAQISRNIIYKLKYILFLSYVPEIDVAEKKIYSNID